MGNDIYGLSFKLGQKNSVFPSPGFSLKLKPGRGTHFCGQTKCQSGQINPKSYPVCQLMSVGMCTLLDVEKRKVLVSKGVVNNYGRFGGGRWGWEIMGDAKVFMGHRHKSFLALRPVKWLLPLKWASLLSDYRMTAQWGGAKSVHTFERGV